MRRRSTANQQAAGVSLFPFLAVLLCTMGAMIVVLVVIARHTRIKVAALAAAAASPDNGLAAKSEELQWRISEMKKSREATQKLLSDKQTELSHLEEHARRLQEQLDELGAAREHFTEMAAGDAKENDELKKRLSLLKADADKTRGEIDKLRRSGGTGNSYAIIPYHGPNETHRRPIYIECLKGRLVLQPEGIELDVRDLAVDTGPTNPLVSSLRAAHDYYFQNQLAGRGVSGTPYPLFLIRPDGIESWLIAQQAISSWGSEFGYELVGQDWKFDFPQPDRMLTVAMRKAVAEARYLQAMLERAAPRLAHSGSGGTFRASRNGGVVQVEGDSPRRGRHPAGRPGWASRRGGGLGGGGSGGSGGSGSGTTDSPAASDGGSSGGLLANSKSSSGDGPVHSIDGNDNPYASALETSPAGGGIGSGGQGTATGAASGNRAPGMGGSTAAGGGPYVGGARGGGIGGVSGAGGGGTLGGSMTGAPPGYGRSTMGFPPGMEGFGQGRGSQLAGQTGPGSGQTGPGYGQPGSPYAQNSSRGSASGSSTASGAQGALSSGNMLASGGYGQNPGSAGVAPGYRGQFGPNPSSVAGQPGGVGNAASLAAPSQAAGANGPGTSDLTGTASANQNIGGPSAVAGPNGFAKGTVVDNGTVISQSAGTSAGDDGSDGQPGGPSANGSATAGASGKGSSGGRNRLGNTAGSNSNPIGQQLANASQSSSSGSSGSSSGSAGQQSSPMSGGSSSGSPQIGGMPMPSPNLNFGPQDPQSSQKQARHRREKNWANPDASTVNVPIQRPIRIVCDSDHLTLLPEGRGKQSMRVIQLKPKTDDSLDELVATVWDRIDSWGTAGRNMYWRPTLVMEIEPGGQRRYAELQAALADSGFDVHGKPRMRTVAPRRVGQVR